MRFRNCILLVLLLVSAATWSQGFPFGTKKIKRPESVLIIYAGSLLAVPGQPPLSRQTIIVRNDLVSSIVDGYIELESVDADKAVVELLDLSSYFVMPGMFDSHVHLSRATGTYQTDMLSANSAPPVAEATLNALVNARLNLSAGFTTLRDMGSDQESVFAVRDSINTGKIVGPTIVASGSPVSVTSGHGDDPDGSTRDERATAGVCDGADECRTLVRYLEKTGSDLIKFKATGGLNSNDGLTPHMSSAEMRAITEAAHLRDIKVAAHAYDSAAIIDAVNAGADSIEHGYLADDAGLTLMKKSGTFLVPTLIVAYPPSSARRFSGNKEPKSVTLRNTHRVFERAYKQGVKIAFGTDAGIYPHGRNADELVRMVELGMSAADAIQTATIAAAELFDEDGFSGTVAPGSKADIIALKSSPLDDISALLEISYVIKAGQVAKRDGQMQLPLNYSLEQKY